MGTCVLCAQTSDIVVQTSCKVWQSQDHLPHEGDGGAPGGGDGAVQAGCGPGLVLGAQGEDWCAERYCLNGDQSRQSNNIVLGWQLLYSRRFEAARRLMDEVLPMALSNQMPHQADQAKQIKKHAINRVMV